MQGNGGRILPPTQRGFYPPSTGKLIYFVTNLIKRNLKLNLIDHFEPPSFLDDGRFANECLDKFFKIPSSSSSDSRLKNYNDQAYSHPKEFLVIMSAQLRAPLKSLSTVVFGEFQGFLQLVYTYIN